MDVVVIAPYNDLYNVPYEVQSVVNALRAKILQGVTDPERLFSFLQSLGTCDVLWFSGHGTDTGIQLSSEVVRYETLAPIVRDLAPSLVFVNTCDSYQTALVVNEITGATVIATATEADDLQAYVTGTRLAQLLADGESYRAAYERSKPAHNRLYMYLEGKGPMAQPQGNRELNAQRQIERIVMLLDGNEELGVTGIRANVRNLQEDMTSLKTDISDLSRRQKADQLEAREERFQLRRRQQTQNYLIAAGALVGITTLISVVVLLMVVL